MRTYDVRTHGCQMNVHDSERLAGLLEWSGLADIASLPERERPECADVVVFNTCAVRENAANKLYGNLGQLRPHKTRNPEIQIAVGGCLAQHERDEIIRRAPWVDVVFGTHNLDALPVLLDRARHNRRAHIEIEESLKVFPSILPARRDSAYSAWVSISVGCNNTCSFCIVPALRGREQDRPPQDVVAEVETLVAQGVVEVTLLGQNVNTYGVQFGDRLAFGRLLRACGSVPGLERLRFTSPHPAAFTADVIDAMAETPTVMPSLHMPLQSGSDRVLRAMRRSYRSGRFLDIVDQVRLRIPEAAITTDVIVGFPGETDADFEETLAVVGQARFASAFTFQYSPRPGTPAAAMPDQVPKSVVQERFNRLISLQEGISWEANRTLEGSTVEVLVAPGEGRKDDVTSRLSGRARDNRLVHFSLPPDGSAGQLISSGRRPAAGETAGSLPGNGLTTAVRSADGPSSAGAVARRPGAGDIAQGRPRPGDLVQVLVTYGAPHHLVADGAVNGGPFHVRRTRGGQAWQDAQANPVPGRPLVSLGMPGVRRPPTQPAGPAGCGAANGGDVGSGDDVALGPHAALDEPVLDDHEAPDQHAARGDDLTLGEEALGQNAARSEHVAAVASPGVTSGR